MARSASCATSVAPMLRWLSGAPLCAIQASAAAFRPRCDQLANLVCRATSAALAASAHGVAVLAAKLPGHLL